MVRNRSKRTKIGMETIAHSVPHMASHIHPLSMFFIPTTVELALTTVRKSKKKK